MVNREYLAMLENKSVIRELSEYANSPRRTATEIFLSDFCRKKNP